MSKLYKKSKGLYLLRDGCLFKYQYNRWMPSCFQGVSATRLLEGATLVGNNYKQKVAA